METEVAKWGNSLGVRLPKALVKKAELKAGDRVDISIERGGKIRVKPMRQRVTLDALLREMRQAARHAETDWGRPRGGSLELLTRRSTLA